MRRRLCWSGHSDSVRRSPNAPLQARRVLVLVLCCSAMWPHATCRADAQGASEGVELLKFPYPYRSALTVCNDADGGSIEKFEAVHTLINTTSRITRSSTMWSLLFADPAIDRCPKWCEGIDGFGLPFGDSIFLWDRWCGGMSLFSAFDKATSTPVLNTYKGNDLSTLFDTWRRNGWVDTLHTPGSDCTREFTAAGLKWLEGRPKGRLKVWVDHCITRNPTCLGPGSQTRALPHLLRAVMPNAAKNGVRLGLIALRKLGIRSLGRNVSLKMSPAPFPPSQALFCWTLVSMMFVLAFWVAVCLAHKRIRRSRTLIPGIVLLLLVICILYFTPLHFGEGANPTSPYYCADLIRQFGFRYFNIQSAMPGYVATIQNTLVVPEANHAGRFSPLHIVKLEDGTSCLAFTRTCLDNPPTSWAYNTLEMLTQENLQRACDAQGWCILYTHWLHEPGKVFTAKALEGLGRLRDFHKGGRVWTTSTPELLDYCFIRTFLQYAVRREQGKRVIDILCVSDPVGKGYVPTAEELRGISFECPTDLPVEMRLAGETIDRGRLEVFMSPERLVVRFPLAKPESAKAP